MLAINIAYGTFRCSEITKGDLMSKSAIALSSRENSTIALKYDYKYCPSCGSAFSSPIRVTVELYEPELGFAGDLSRHYDYSDDVT